METPPGTHIFYIPVILLLGMVLGFLLGKRATESVEEDRQRRYDDDLDDY